MLAAQFLLEAVLLSYFFKIAFNGVSTYRHIFSQLNWLGHMEGKGSHWKHIIIVFVVVKFICVVVSFMSLVCWHFGLELAAAVACTFMPKVGSSAFVA